MIGYLLDTSAALLALAEPDRLSLRVRTALLRANNYLSVVSFWEVLLKSVKGKLEVGDARVWWRDTLDQLGATALVLRPEHIAEVYALPPFHKDPFDRILIAQAIVEDMSLVTTDSLISRYASQRFRVLS